MAHVVFAQLVSTPSHFDASSISLRSCPVRSLPAFQPCFSTTKAKKSHPQGWKAPAIITCLSSAHKLIRDPRLDKNVEKQNSMRFVQKLKALLLSKPKHFMPIKILYKCRSYLSLPRPRSIISMIRRYPTIFDLFMIPTPSTPFHATGPLCQLCVRLTPAAASLAKKETELKKCRSVFLAQKLQKLLMLASPYHSLLLSKLVHLGPDLGLPVDFRSHLCYEHPDKFKVVNTSYGRALELMSWDSNLANVLPLTDEVKTLGLGLIVDRPLKFKHLKLRKGLNIKRHHRDYLIKFGEFADVCPYTTNSLDLVKESIEAEKRACAVVREVLGMTVEKRTLVDHVTHFRKEFGLPNKLRGMLVRHPEMFYVSLKGQRDSVFLVEGYNDKGTLLEMDDILVIKDELMGLVKEGKKIRREQRREYVYGDSEQTSSHAGKCQADSEYYDECEDGLDDLFQQADCISEDYVDDDESDELNMSKEKEKFWMAETSSSLLKQKDYSFDTW